MLNDLERVIADLEFKKFASLFAREKQRKQLDTAKEAVKLIENKLKEAKGDEKGALSDEKERIEASVKNYEETIKQSDAEIYGYNESGLVAPPAPGFDPPLSISKKLEHYAETRELLKIYIKENI